MNSHTPWVHLDSRCFYLFGCSALFGVLSIGCFCFIPGDVIAFITLQGTLVHGAAGTPVEGAVVGASFIVDGEVTSDFPPFNSATGAPQLPPTSAEGTFAITFIEGFNGRCVGQLGPPVPPPEIPQPDQVELIVVADGCEQRLIFDVNANNFVDPMAADHELQFANPVVVPSCPESTERR